MGGGGQDWQKCLFFKPFSSKFITFQALCSPFSELLARGYLGGVHSDLKLLLETLRVPYLGLYPCHGDANAREEPQGKLLLFSDGSLILTLNKLRVPRRGRRDLAHPCPMAEREQSW